MCELFGYSSNKKQPLSRWLTPFRARGGGSADNPDGWGVAIWDHGIAKVVKSAEPGFSSVQFASLARGLRSQLSIAHVRKARHPPVVGMLNTHPFTQTCCNREWVFAHNGMVPEVIAWQTAESRCHPQGETDSEYAFCHLLTEIAGSYDKYMHRGWISHLANLSEKISALGKFNFLLSDGQLLIAYGHDRLHYLDLEHETIIATEALTEEPWLAFLPGELRVYRHGRLIAQLVGTAIPAITNPITHDKKESGTPFRSLIGTLAPTLSKMDDDKLSKARGGAQPE